MKHHILEDIPIHGGRVGQDDYKRFLLTQLL